MPMKTTKMFQKKILLIFVIVFIVQFICVYFVILFDRYDRAQNQQETINKLFLNNEAVYIEKLLYLGILSINDISRNTLVANFLNSESAPSIESTLDFYSIFRNTYIIEYSRSFSKLGGFVDNNTLIALDIYSPNNNLIFSDFLKSYDNLDEETKELARKNNEIFLETDDRNNIFLLKTVYLKNLDEPTIIKITFSGDIFARTYDENLSNYGNLILEIGGHTYHLNPAHSFTGKTIENTAAIVAPDYSWINAKLTYISSQNRILKMIVPDVLILSASFLFLLTVGIIILHYTSKHLTNRLYFLVDDINNDIMVENTVSSKREKDEFDIIRNKILDMTQIINKREKELFENEIEKKNIETRLLQELFNPHFLYNTLSCVKYKFKGNQTLEKIIDEMVNYYRVALNRGNMKITLKNELSMIESYMELQNFAYEKNIDLKIFISENLYEQRTIKMLLQPLVENAFFHAFRHMDGDCAITIDIKEQQENIVIRVIDNGVGMEPDKIRELLEAGHKTDEFGLPHYGIYNTNMKIQTYYGPQYGIGIKSALGEGTEVTIEIPKKAEEEPSFEH